VHGAAGGSSGSGKGRAAAPAVVDALAAAWLLVGGLGEFRRLPLPPAAVRRPAVVLRE